MNNNKNLWISIGIVVLVVIALVVWSKHNNNPLPAVDTTPTEDVSAGSANAPATGSTSSAALLSYNDAIIKYKDFRIQFDEACTANPFSVDYQNGKSVMLDNRAGVARTIKIGPNTYSIKKYGFKIVKISSATVPMAYSVDCDAHPNVGTIRLRK
jgi:hypothetical protein